MSYVETVFVPLRGGCCAYGAQSWALCSTRRFAPWGVRITPDSQKYGEHCKLPASQRMASASVCNGTVAIVKRDCDGRETNVIDDFEVVSSAYKAGGDLSLILTGSDERGDRWKLRILLRHFDWCDIECGKCVCGYCACISDAARGRGVIRVL